MGTDGYQQGTWARAATGVGDRCSRLFTGRARVWVTALIVALLAWPVAFGVAGTGPDLSWMGGLYMGIHDGKDFGSEIVFTYGPLGFLDWPILWYSGLAVLAFAFTAVLYLALVVTLIAVLERAVGLLAAALIAFLFCVSIPDLEQVPLILGVGLALLALREDRPGYAVGVLAAGGGALAAVECLVKLSVGPVILVVCLLAMFGARADRRQWAAFGVTFLGGSLLLWLIASQSPASLWDYAKNGAQVVSGYNEAMGVGGAERWEEVALVLGAGALVVASVLAPLRDRRARWSGTLLVAVAAFATFKYGIVRFEPNHAALAFSALLGIWLVIPWPRRRAAAFLACTVVVGAIALHAYPSSARLDPVQNLTAFIDSAELVARPGRRQQLVDEGRANLQATYALEPRTLAAMEGKRVAVEPWEIAVAWAYELDWQPLPVFQNYTAYTPDLDRLNSAQVESPDGPQVILRQNPGNPLPFGARSLEGRLPAWDPPEQSFAIACNFTPVRTTPTWQVLERTADRCGEPRLIASRTAEPGETVAVPRAHRDEIVLLRLGGAKIEGLERIKSLLWRAPVETAVLNDGLVSYRLVPGTTGDGLVVSRDPALDGKGPFAQLPQLTDIRVEGADGPLTYDFYGVRATP